MDNQLLLGSLFGVIHIWLVLNLISKVHTDLAVWVVTLVGVWESASNISWDP